MGNVISIKRSITRFFNHTITEKDNIEAMFGVPLLGIISVDEVKENEIIHSRKHIEKYKVESEDIVC